MRFDLYLESGSQHCKTWVYVPSLPGCSVMAPTSEQAIEGEVVPDPEPIELVAADHSIEGEFLGYGQGAFPSDREPMSAHDAASQLRWAEWTREELARVVERGPGKPVRSALRMLRRLLEHEWEHALELRSRSAA